MQLGVCVWGGGGGGGWGVTLYATPIPIHLNKIRLKQPGY